MDLGFSNVLLHTYSSDKAFHTKAIFPHNKFLT